MNKNIQLVKLLTEARIPIKDIQVIKDRMTKYDFIEWISSTNLPKPLMLKISLIYKQEHQSDDYRPKRKRIESALRTKECQNCGKLLKMLATSQICHGCYIKKRSH